MSADVPADRVLPPAAPHADIDLHEAKRRRIRDALEGLGQSGSVLDPWGSHASVNDPTMFLATPEHAPLIPLPARLHLHREVEEEPETALPANPPTGAVLLTAGVPGAGKSYRLNELGLLDGARLIDSDVYKERLLARLIEVDDPWLLRRMADVEATLGVPVAPLEMAAVVHQESLALADTALREALRTSERVVFAGTCTDEGFVRRVLRMVRDGGRNECQVLLVEVPAHLARERAEGRWWAGRQAFERGDNPMGARYVPASVISGSFSGGMSRAARTIANIISHPEPGVRLVRVPE